jgi:alanine racemase
MQLDMVRAGIAMYGLSPSNETICDVLKPAMQLKSVIIQINDLNAGDTVSYGRQFEAEKNCRIAVVSIGYGDGYYRLLSGKDSVLVNGKRASLVGRICMDVFMIDVTDIKASVGDTVTIFGEDNGQMKSINEMADLLETINYELLCAISKRIKRVYEVGWKFYI